MYFVYTKIFTTLCLGPSGDDEQSDFFHEAGSSSGIIPWWENENLGQQQQEEEQQDMDSRFQQLLEGSFQHLSADGQQNFKARLKMMGKVMCER